MPQHTVTEFRGRNKLGHDSKTDRDKNGKRNRSGSPIPKHFGNHTSGFCTYCNATLSHRLQTKKEIRTDMYYGCDDPDN